MEKRTNSNESEICDALKKGTAFEVVLHGAYDVILCGEEKCLKGYEERSKEGDTLYTCPLSEKMMELIRKQKNSQEKSNLDYSIITESQNQPLF